MVPSIRTIIFLHLYPYNFLCRLTLMYSQILVKWHASTTKPGQHFLRHYPCFPLVGLNSFCMRFSGIKLTEWGKKEGNGRWHTEAASLCRASGLRVEVAQEVPVPGYLDNSFGRATTAFLLKAPGFCWRCWVALSLALFIHSRTQWGTFISHGFLYSLGKILRYQPGASPTRGIWSCLIYPHRSLKQRGALFFKKTWAHSWHLLKKSHYIQTTLTKSAKSIKWSNWSRFL